MNTVKLNGRVCQIYNGRNITTVVLYMKGFKYDYPHIAFIGADRVMLEDVKIGDFVTIVGTIKVRQARNDEGRNYFIQSIRGKSIDKLDEPSYCNEVHIEGTVALSTERHNMMNVVVNPDNEQFNVLAIAFANNKISLINELAVGDRVRIDGRVITSKKGRGENRRRFEDILIKRVRMSKEESE